MKVDPARRSRINTGLDQAGLNGSRSFLTIGQGVNTIGSILRKHEVEWTPPSPRLFKGGSGQKVVYVSLDTNLRIGWYQHPSGSYEITAYLS